jgi:microcystin-dependent protein
MATEPYIGEIRIFSFNFNPKGWAMCNGQLLAINQNAALFSILGTTYGGNGQTTFALPNLQGNVPIHSGGGTTVLGQVGGSANVTLGANQFSHSHAVSANATPNAYGATNNFPASAPPAAKALYGPAANTAMNPAILSSAGGSVPHNNLQPYLVVNFCIALSGIFPSRS